jgi:dihydrodipicolinate synthase/N-acetylneuraminate lyase
MASLTMGCKGLCSSVGTVISKLQLDLFHAVKGNDLALAREINERVVPITDALYEPPTLELHNRTKAALVTLGGLRSGVVRPPLGALSQPELDRIRVALAASRLLAPELLRSR